MPARMCRDSAYFIVVLIRVNSYTMLLIITAFFSLCSAMQFASIGACSESVFCF